MYGICLNISHIARSVNSKSPTFPNPPGPPQASRCQPCHSAVGPAARPALRWAQGWAAPGAADRPWAPCGCAGGRTWPSSRGAPGVFGAPEVKRWGEWQHRKTWNGGFEDWIFWGGSFGVWGLGDMPPPVILVMLCIILYSRVCTSIA